MTRPDSPAEREAWTPTEPIKLPAVTDRGLAGQIMDAAWPEFGGQQAGGDDFWWTFGDAVTFTIHALRTRRPSEEELARSVEAADYLIGLLECLAFKRTPVRDLAEATAAWTSAKARLALFTPAREDARAAGD